VWVPVQRRVPAHRPPDSHVRLPWGDRTAWVVAGYLSLNSIVFYSLLAWLAPLFEDRGVSAAEGGYLVATLNLVQLVAALTVPAIADLRVDRRPVFAVVVGASVVGLVWLLAWPGTWSFVVVALLGFGLGAGFTLGLVLLVDYAPDPAASARLTALAFLVSYLVAALGPVVCGALRDATGGYTASLVVLLVLGVSQLLLVPSLRPGRQVH
jgi:CP family cyanate transporter-like MFS transporter